jgi:CBS-domain-containing membrane protein
MQSSPIACQVHERASLLDALRAIQEGGAGLALVTDDAGRVVGIMTDANVRQALLQGHGMQSPLEHFADRDIRCVRASASRTEVLDLMAAHKLHAIPVVDESGKFVSLHLRHEVIGAVERPNWAVIMAGGKGTRLRPITDRIPKPMIKVAGRPILSELCCIW